MSLPDGYTDIPAGKVAFVATSLEMLARPALGPLPGLARYAIRSVPNPDPDWYRDLFRRVGTDWLWFSRLKLATSGLAAIIQHPDVAVYALAGPDGDDGLLELDFRVPGECEIAYFGIGPALIGHGAGRALMNVAIEEAWRRPIRRFWVHTCTGDHPAALAFYMRSSFVPFKRQIEIADDPRLLGLLPHDCAPHVPLIHPG